MKTHLDRIKGMISRLYEPADPSDFDVKLTTTEIYQDLCTIIPANAIDEFNVVDVLEEMGFEPNYESKSRETERTVVTGDDGEITTEKVIEKYDDLRYYWYMRNKY